MTQSERWGLLYLFLAACGYFKANGWPIEIYSIRIEGSDNAQAQNNQESQKSDL